MKHTFTYAVTGIVMVTLLTFSSNDELAKKITPNNALTPKEKREGFKLLFDGKSFSNWRTFKKQTIGKDWIIDDQAICLNAKDSKTEHGQTDGGDLITKEKYGNYELKLDWKVAPCANSGVIYNVQELDSTQYVWQTGPEMQILDNNCHPDGKIEKHRTGDLYDLIKSSKETVKPVGEWNHIVLRQKNGFVEQYLNGTKTASVQIGGTTWNKLVAGSKFKAMPYFGKFTEGYIALQDHGNKVWFRNIKIRALDK